MNTPRVDLMTPGHKNICITANNNTTEITSLWIYDPHTQQGIQALLTLEQTRAVIDTLIEIVGDE